MNLGAGYDTLFWRFKDSNVNITSVIDVDFPTVTAKKCYNIKQSSTLLQTLHSEGGSKSQIRVTSVPNFTPFCTRLVCLSPDGEISFSGTDLHSSNYHIIGVDLRNINDLEYKLIQCGIDYSLPTLFIAECVLVYIENVSSQRLLLWISGKFDQALFVSYEQVSW